MATIGKIRKHSTLLLIVIGGAIVLFVLGDLLGPGKGGGSNSIPDIAVLGKEKVSYRDYSNKLEEQLDFYKQQYGQNIDNNMIFQIREEVFNEMVRQTIYSKEYKALGLKVSKAEMVDMMTGVNIHQIIKQNFTDPQTGVFNPSLVENYLMHLDELDARQQSQWFMIENVIKEQRLQSKYQTMISKAYFMPTVMAKSMQKQQNMFADAKVFSLKYNAIPDEETTITNKDYQNYYNNHKLEYEQEHSVYLDYVIFDVLPSSRDMEFAKESIEDIYNEFIEIPFEDKKENFLFANNNSDVNFRADTGFIKREELPTAADSLFDKNAGFVIGPYIENNVYHIHKLLTKENRPDSLKAAHILVAYKGALRSDPAITRTKDDAKIKADSLLVVVKNVDSLKFAQTATDFSDDKSASNNGGNLDWFIDGTMVPEFNQACIDNKVGDYFVVESPFGFHIVHLTGKKAFETKAKIANIQYTIEASSETMQIVYTEASKFAGENKTIEEFDNAIAELGYVKRTSEHITTSDFTIPGIQDGREIIRWAFGKNAKLGLVSDVFDLITENKNVVVLIRDIREKGIPALADIKDEIMPQVIKEKKAEMLKQKINDAKANNIEALAKSFNEIIIDVENANFASINVPMIGPEAKVLGTIFATNKDVMSKPIQGSAGVFVIQTTNIELPQESNDNMYEMLIANQKRNFTSRVSYELYNALLKNANLKENKTLFY